MQLVSKLHDVVESIDFTAIDIGLKVAAKRLQNALERSGPLKLCSFRQRIPDLRYLVNDFPPGALPPHRMLSYHPCSINNTTEVNEDSDKYGWKVCLYLYAFAAHVVGIQKNQSLDVL